MTQCTSIAIIYSYQTTEEIKMKTIIKENGTEITKMTREETGVTDTPWETEEKSYMRITTRRLMSEHNITKEEATKNAKELWEWAK